MKLGVLETGPIAQKIAPQYGSYTDFFRRFVQSVDPDIAVEGWVVHDGKFPQSPDVCDGWIITGSKHGAYEDHSWIAPLEAFLREAASLKRPMAGICFGHQILAKAFGGQVEKSAKGWGLGSQSYALQCTPNWMGETPESYAAIAVHQDQITVKPEDASVISSNEFCEHAALVYGDPDKPYAISIQPHPEFDEGYVTDLINVRRGSVFDPDLADRAIASLSKKPDNHLWSDWIVRYFKLTVDASDPGSRP